jgi:integrase/recombinase XerD
MSNAGIPLRVIQKISGHHSLEVLQEYLEVSPEQVRGAASSLSMLSHASHNLQPSGWDETLENEAIDSQLPTNREQCQE